jgi:hypothetical protein
MPDTLEGTISQGFEDLNDYRDQESEAMGKFNETFDNLKEAIETQQEESLNLGLCHNDGLKENILHNCVFQMLLGKLGAGLDPNVEIQSIRDTTRQAREEISTYPDFCHVHTSCNEIEVKAEIDRVYPGAAN